MNRIDELKKELESLPAGYISHKNINGKARFYLQHREGSRIVSKYIKDEEIEPLKKKISRRKEIEDEIRYLLKTTTTPLAVNLSSNAKLLTGDIMEEDEVVASFTNGELTYINEKRAPLEIIKTGNVRAWLEGRSIDHHRTNSRLLKKVLRMSEKDEIQSVLCVYARTLTDNFWFRPHKSKIHFKDLQFLNDMYSDTSLKGFTRDISSKPSFNPELTLIGSYEKCWKLIDDTWYMYKTGTENEIFSEIFCSSLCGMLKIPTAVYERYGKYIRTRNFTEDYDFEPLRAVAGDDDRYEVCFPIIYSISKDLATQYLLLMWFDCLVYNVDRHNENCGFLRNRKTGEIVSLAPNFDNNLALFAREIPAKTDRNNDGMIKLFKKFILKNNDAREIYAKLALPVVTKDMVDSILAKAESPVKNDFLFEYLDNGQKELKIIQNECLNT